MSKQNKWLKLQNEEIKIFNMLKTFANNVEIGLYVSDYYTCEILFVNKHTILYTGGSDTECFIGKPCWTIADTNAKERCPFCPYKRLIDENGKPNEPYTWELYIPCANKWLKFNNRAIEWEVGRLAQLVTFYDITDIKKMQEKLDGIAYIDRLLQMKNELMLAQNIKNAVIKPSLIVFDILSFQKVNEAYGRDIGDCLLQKIRDWILEQKIDNSMLYRIGGDEFCITVENAGAKQLNLWAENLSARFMEPWIFDFNDDHLKIFCSISIAVILGNYVTESEPLLNLIERTLDAAKKQKSITIYDGEMDEDYKRHLRFELNLKKCTRESMEGFNVFYQPIVEAQNGRWCGLEALCRWNSPEFGFVSPELFIPEAERLELIGTIGNWVLETSVRECWEWGLSRFKDFILHINVSSAQFTDEEFGETIIAVINKYNFPGENLCIEITESTQFTFTGSSMDTIKRLRDNKILVALDDFGTGYANFYQLKSIPADILKIERAFVADIENDDYTRYLFRVLTDLAHTAKMKLVAEGVENKEQMTILAENGADFLQGYLFGKPLSHKELENMLILFED